VFMSLSPSPSFPFFFFFFFFFFFGDFAFLLPFLVMFYKTNLARGSAYTYLNSSR